MLMDFCSVKNKQPNKEIKNNQVIEKIEKMSEWIQ